METSVIELLPHRPPMVVVDELIEVNEEARTARCSCSIPDTSPILIDGAVPMMLLVEMLAQSAACLKGWIELQKGLPVRPAYLVRVDDLSLSRAPAPGESVEVLATEQRGLGDYFVYHAEATAGGDGIARGSLRFIVDSAEPGR